MNESPPATTENPFPTPNVDGNNTAQVMINSFLLLLLGFLVYHNALFIPLQGDDLAAFAEGGKLSRVVTWPAAQDALPHGPLSLLGLSLNSVVGGGSASVLHVGSLLLHLLNAVLVYLLVRVLLHGRGHELTAAIAGFFLLVHPAATQSVAYLVDRPALQGTTFTILALIAWLKATESLPLRVGVLLLSGGLYLAAVASCTLALVTPLVALLLRPGVWKQSAPTGGALFILALAGVALGAADALPALDVLLPTFLEALTALVTFSPPSLAPVGAPPHWAAWWAYFLIAAIGCVFPVLLRFVRAQGVRASAGVVIGLGVIGLAIVSYQQVSLWTRPAELWGAHADDASAQVALGRYYRHAATTAPDNDETLAALRNAGEAFDQATRLDSGNADAHALLGQTLLELGQAGQARAALSQALRHAPFHREAHLALAQILATRAATTGDTGALEQARRHLAVVAETGDLDTPYRVQYAGILTQLGEYRLASEILEGLPEEALSPEAAPLRQQAANAAVRIAQLKRNALENPQDPNAAVGQAEAALLSGKLQSALYMLDRFVRQDPTNGNAWELLGVLHAEADRLNAFIESWGDAPASSPDRWRRMATRVAAGGNWRAAGNMLARATGKDAQSLEGRLDLAGLATELNRPVDATRLLREAAEAFPESPAPWEALAEVVEELQQPEAAARFRQEAVKRQHVEGAESREIRESEAPVPGEERPKLPAPTLIR